MSQINKPTAPLVTIDPDTKADLVNGEVPSEQLPSYVDDVLEFDSVDEFPEEGETGKIYVDLETNYTYRWSGSAYVQVGGGGSGGDIEINDYSSTPADIVGRIKINGTNYEVESEYQEAQLIIEVNSSKLDTRISQREIEGLLDDYNGEVPLYNISCFIVVNFDGRDLPPFHGSVAVKTDGEGDFTGVYVYSDDQSEFYFEYDNEAEAFLSEQLFMPRAIVSDLAEQLEEETGKPVEVETIHSLWLPEEQKFVKFAGGNTPRNTIEFFIPDDWDGDFAQLLQSQDQELLFNLITDSLDGIAAGLSVPVVCFDQLGNRYEFTATDENCLDFRIEPNQATASIGDYGYDTFALICGSIIIEVDAETGDGRIYVTINEKTRYATALYVHNLYFYGQVGGSNQWFCLQYKSTSSKRNVEQPTFASELCDLQLGDYIWHQWHEHDAHLYNATVVINEDPPSTIRADDELTVLGAQAPGEDELHISFVDNGTTKTVAIANVGVRDSSIHWAKYRRSQRRTNNQMVKITHGIRTNRSYTIQNTSDIFSCTTFDCNVHRAFES